MISLFSETEYKLISLVFATYMYIHAKHEKCVTCQCAYYDVFIEIIQTNQKNILLRSCKCFVENVHIAMPKEI